MALDLNDIDEITNQALSNIYSGVGPALGGPGDGSQPGFEKLAANTLQTVRDFDVSQTVLILKIIGISLSLFFGVLLIWLVVKMRNKYTEKIVELKDQVNPPAVGESKYDARWKEVLEHLQSLRDAEWKFAVIEADNIVEDILTQAGYPGETLGEKLKQINKNQLASIDSLWSAHKLRNLIVHDPDYQIRYNDAREAIRDYEKALRELGVLG
ncbi:MAG: hypothetical protein HYX21_01730 [Candidatus Yanofskybacteria bacterium]|nr:hypothetical protein [Candidatus Yanofskybacteria bacterium]